MATAVARPASNVTAARWGGDGPLLCWSWGRRRARYLLYEPVATTGYVQDAESQATLSCPSRPSTPKTPKTPKAMRKRKPSPPARPRSAR